MRIGRTLPPAAAPLSWRDISAGLLGMVRGASEIQRFKKELQAYFNCRHCFLVSSGKAALTLILSALKEIHPERDHVLIPAFTCYSVPSAIVKAGLKVSLCDIDSATLDFNERHLQKKLDDPHLLCVIPVHLFGIPANIERIRALINDPELLIVEDAAQAMGGEHDGRKLGTLGDVGIFSLSRGKALSSVEGGVILTDRDDLAAMFAKKFSKLEEYSGLQILALFLYALALSVLIRPALFWLPKNMPFLRLGETIFDPNFPMRKLTSLQAGLTRNWKDKLEDLKRIRCAAVNYWKASLNPSVPPSWGKSSSPLLRFPVMLPSIESAHWVVEEGSRQGLGIAPSYPDSIHRLPELAGQFVKEEYPAATDASRRMVTLPVHGYVTAGDRKKILRLLNLANSGLSGRQKITLNTKSSDAPWSCLSRIIRYEKHDS